jgi:hypothetical protein
MNRLDQFIKSAATTFHEIARQAAVGRRHARDREAEAAREVDQLMDRILFHYPLTKRESRHDLSDEQFKQLRMAEAAHRTQLLLSVIARLASDAEGATDHFENTDLTF